MNELEATKAAPTPGRGLGFSLFGFPTKIDPSFLIIVALIGFSGTIAHLLIWVALAVVGVLGHELGHALAARRLGGTATISLQGLGGLTRCSRVAPLTRRESAFFTIAGPAAGFLMGIPVFLALHSLGWEPWTTGGYALRTAAFVTLGWSVFNLLPVLPLDGGSLLELALPGPALVRRLWALRVSIALGGVGAAVAYRAGWTYTALLALMLAAQNFSSHKAIAEACRHQASAEPDEALPAPPNANDSDDAVEVAPR